MFGIDYLISPVEFDHFREHHYGKKGILIPGDSGKFRDLVGWEEINHLARYSQLGGKSTKLVLDKKHLHPSEIGNFNHWIKEGATFTINHMQSKDPVVDKYARILSAELNTTVNINCYISAPSKQGFDNHYDGHDVFIIQVEGEKEWKVFKPKPGIHTDPVDRMNIDKGDPPDKEPYIECTMGPGDVLYIPRGHWHYAISKSPCIHLTVGPQARTPGQFMQWYINKLNFSDGFFRKNLPIAEAGEYSGRRSDSELKAFIREFQDYMGKLITNKNFEEELHEFVMTSNILTERPSAVFPGQQTIADDVKKDTRFALPAGQKIIMKYDTENQRAEIQIRGGKISIDAIKEKQIEAIFSGNVISGESIMAQCPDIQWKDVKRTLLVLLDRGVIILLTDEHYEHFGSE